MKLETTSEEPIVCVNYLVDGTGSLTVSTMPLADIDPDFEEFCGLTDCVVGGLLGKTSSYDDSDPGEITVLFFTDRPQDVQEQWLKMLAEHLPCEYPHQLADLVKEEEAVDG